MMLIKATVQFKWLKEDYPSASERVKSKVRSGQFYTDRRLLGRA